ncbi:MAG: hypothetical protein GY812_01515 [Actinomycetia bacterium]|nr:hypothetical protein [Actinomycetes bacterium]
MLRRLLAVIGVSTIVAAACAVPSSPGSGGPPVTLPDNGEPFTIVFIGDSEPRMRGNTNAELSAYVQNLLSYKTTTERYFDADGGIHRIDPELVILGGDISEDRGTSIANDLPIWQPLYNAGVPFIAGFGNHDWDPDSWGDGPGYSLAGHLSNENTRALVAETQRRSAATTPQFTYQQFGPTSAHGPDTYLSAYRGVGIASFNTYLYHPSYFYPEGWPASCNPLLGGAGCQRYVSAESQIQALEDALDPDPSRPMLFVQHYPLTTGSGWWNDYGVSGATVSQQKDRLLGLMDRFDEVALLAGHNHSSGHYTHNVGGRELNEYVAPYFGGGNGEDLTRGGGFVALLVSSTRGIIEVKTIPGGIA